MTPGHQDDDRRITYFAATHTRGKREMFGIRGIDRSKHIYVIGKTGMGKSTMLENLAIQDIQNGEGIAFIDPHGSTAEKLLDFVPHDRINDVIYFAPFDTDHPVGFNVMEDVGYDKRHLVVSGLMGALKRIWVDAWSARMEYILQNTLLGLLEYPGSTLLDVNRMLTNKNFRNAVIEKITDPIVKAFWTDEFANFTDTYTREATPAIQNKIGQFVANPLIRNIVGQPTSSFDIRKAMDEKKIFIVNLSKGRMGETNASLLGSMLTVKIYLASMSRADEPPTRMAKLPRFFFYVDEFQSMMNEAFADILSESRKYKLALTLANQYIEQMEEEVRDAVFGNVGTLITFRVGPFDAEVLKTVFEPTFTAEDLVGLGVGQIYLTLMIDGVGSPPFSAETIPPIEAPTISYREDVVTQSREKYARPRADVEATISQKQSEFVMPPPAPKEKRYGGGGGGFKPTPSPIEQRRAAAPREEALGRSQTGEAGNFDRRTGEFVRREEESNDRVYVPPTRPMASMNPPQAGAPQQSVGHAGQVAPLGHRPTGEARPATPPPPPRPAQPTEEEKRNALRAAISLAGRASAAPPSPATAKSPAELLRERLSGGGGPKIQAPKPPSPPQQNRPQPTPAPRPVHAPPSPRTPQAQPDRSWDSAAPLGRSQTLGRNPMGESGEARPAQPREDRREHNPNPLGRNAGETQHTPRVDTSQQQGAAPRPEIRPMPPEPPKQQGASEVSIEMLKRVLNEVKDDQ